MGKLRLAELVAALSLGVDLGFGQPMEHVLRQCLIGLRVAERIGLGEPARATVYYTALLVNVGCHSDAHEQAKWFGDDIAFKSGKYTQSLRSAAAVIGRIGAGQPPMHRFRIGLELLVSGKRHMDAMISSHAALARGLAEQLRLPHDVVASVGAAYEYWNGRGWPGELRGATIPMGARIAQLAEYVEVAHRVGGMDAVRELARKQGGKRFDPELSNVLLRDGASILEALDSVGAWDAVIGAEPALAVVLDDDAFDAALAAIANFIDLKSPYSLGHSTAVADLAGSAAALLGVADVRTVRRAALVVGFGRLGISNSIWDKPGPLGSGEWERVRMQPYFTERMLRQSSALEPYGAIAVQHRERLDGSGYPRGISGTAISKHARIVATADAYQAMREPRPHRAAHSPEEAANLLRAEARAGKLDGEVIEAVLEASGQRARRRPEGPAGLTLREVEVLRVLAQGLSTKEIALKLGMSPKTASNHIEHIYAKTGATNRVAASLFAVQNGLLP